jgi:C-terminal processing protease CtpA/Prc
MSWVWRERRPWGTSACTQLLDGGFASGHLDYSEPGALDPAAAPALYWAAVADATRGAWTRPAYVLTDAYTGSAAEAFTALMHDRGVAKTIGTRTRGLGCGFVDFDAPFVLPSARLAFRIPNCARLRGDGTDEVAGIAPDLPMNAAPGESSRALALRALQTIAAENPVKAPPAPPDRPASPR